KLIHDFLHIFQPRFPPPHRHRLCSLSLFLSLIMLQRESSPLWESIARRRRDSPIGEKEHTDHFSIHIGALSQIYCNTVSSRLRRTTCLKHWHCVKPEHSPRTCRHGFMGWRLVEVGVLYYVGEMK
ncbi:unnamed protein product, partial [Brassica rapa subsp. trilocularis]